MDPVVSFLNAGYTQIRTNYIYAGQSSSMPFWSYIFTI